MRGYGYSLRPLSPGRGLDPGAGRAYGAPSYALRPCIWDPFPFPCHPLRLKKPPT